MTGGIHIPEREVPVLTRREHAQDPTMTAKAKGILWLCFSCEPGTRLDFVTLVGYFRDGEHAIRTGVRELITRGYLGRRKQSRKGGRFGPQEYDLLVGFSTQLSTEGENRHTVTPSTEGENHHTVGFPPYIENILDTKGGGINGMSKPQKTKSPPTSPQDHPHPKLSTKDFLKVLEEGDHYIIPDALDLNTRFPMSSMPEMFKREWRLGVIPWIRWWWTEFRKAGMEERMIYTVMISVCLLAREKDVKQKWATKALSGFLKRHKGETVDRGSKWLTSTEVKAHAQRYRLTAFNNTQYRHNGEKGEKARWRVISQNLKR